EWERRGIVVGCRIPATREGGFHRSSPGTVAGGRCGDASRACRAGGRAARRTGGDRPASVPARRADGASAGWRAAASAVVAAIESVSAELVVQRPAVQSGVRGDARDDALVTTQEAAEVLALDAGLQPREHLGEGSVDIERRRRTRRGVGP